MFFDYLAKYSDPIGLVGVVIILIAYYLLNIEKMRSNSLDYLIANLIGSCMILVSLFFNWNLSSVIIEIAWILISLMGMYRVLKKKVSTT